MKPAPFSYHRPDTLEQALHLLDEHGPDAKPLAGGQSLVPAMNFRLAQPPVLVDLNRVASLAGLEALDDGGLRLGGMTRQRAVEHSPLVAERAPLLAATMPWIAHPPIRTRGTIGGSLAHADPAAELPAVMLALGATIGVRSRAGARAVPASEFFLGLFATALMPGELLVEVTIPPPRPGAGWAMDEIARRHGDFALAGVAAVVVLGDGGRVASAAVALIGAHDRAIRATAAERVLVGEAPTATVLREAGAAAARVDADPGSDVHASAAYRRHLIGVLVPRVVAHAVSRAAGGA
jgi:aerobic carbon-monoxide dehydrogenase medium subunit